MINKEILLVKLCELSVSVVKSLTTKAQRTLRNTKLN